MSSARVNLAEGEQRTPAYLAINPKGRVPALADGDWVVTEVPAILRYVVADLIRAPRLWPATRATRRAAPSGSPGFSSTVHVAYAHVRRAGALRRQRCRQGRGDRQGERAPHATSGRRWNSASGSQTWSRATASRVADLYLLVFWTWGRGPTLGFDMPADFPHWTAHARRMAERPAVRRVFERDGIVLPGPPRHLGQVSFGGTPRDDR